MKATVESSRRMHSPAHAGAILAEMAEAAEEARTTAVAAHERRACAHTGGCEPIAVGVSERRRSSALSRRRRGGPPPGGLAARDCPQALMP